MPEIVPSPITNNPQELRDMITRVEDLVTRFQIDIIDGQFAANKTIDPSVLEDFDTTLKLDYQLMVRNPTDWVERCVRGMADRIIGQIEMMDNQVEFVGKVQETGCKVGLAIDIETPVGAIDKEILSDLDTVLVLAVPAGFGGQKFDSRAIQKIKELHAIRAHDDTPFSIIADGGITIENIRDVVRAGADEIAIGRRLFDEGDPQSFIESLRKEASFYE